MAMDKRWGEMFARLDAIENELKNLQQPAATAVSVTKEHLTAIKGVGSSTADAILELLNS